MKHSQTVVIPFDRTFYSEGWDEVLYSINQSNELYINNLAQQFNVPHSVACDIWYLRTRSRGTHALEAAIIRCHRVTGESNFRAGLGEEAEVLRVHGCWTKKLQRERLGIQTRQKQQLTRMIFWLKIRNAIQQFFQRLCKL